MNPLLAHGRHKGRAVMNRLTIADASKVSGADFLRRLTGQPPMSKAEVAEHEAKAARVKLIQTIERVEFARARREREAMLKDGQGDETYEQFRERANRPFIEARQRVEARMAAYDQQRAA